VAHPRTLFALALLSALVALVGVRCTELGGDAASPPDGGLRPYTINPTVDDKSKLYSLIGRWYPTDEVKRLSDVTLTPEEWCKREPTVLTVMPDQVESQCEKGEYSAGIAVVKTSTQPGEIALVLRSPKDSPFRQIRFAEVRGPKAIITGNPCFGGAATPHQRFPEYEILTRQILGGRRCSQLTAANPPSP
jgi:hypothetical protein